jgi:Family of unknown function (DUF6263)
VAYTITSTRRAVPIVAVLAATGLVAGGGAVANAQPVTSLSTAGGGGDQITFPVEYTVGQAATTEGTFGVSLSLDGFGVSETYALTFDMRLVETVEEVDEDGGAVIHTTIEDVNVVDAPDELDTSTYEDLAGIVVAEHRDAQGHTDSSEILNEDELSEEQRIAADEFLSGFDAAQVDYPDGPVGVGAEWTSEQTVQSGGVELPATYEYRLAELTEETYTIEMTVDSDIDEEVDGAEVDGRFTGQGTFTGDRDNPLALSMTFRLDGVADVEADGDSASMEISFDIELAPVESSAAASGSTGAVTESTAT